MNRKFVILLLMTFFLLLIVFISIMFGGSKMKAAEVFYGILHPWDANSSSTIIWHIRFPRIILGILVGMGLASSGCVFQGMLRNPLADPYTLGISGGAAFGATVGIISGLTNINVLFMPVCAFIGTLLCILLVYFISSRKNFSLSSLILSGVILGFFFSSFVLLIYAVSDAQKIHSTILWLMGDLSSPETSLLKVISIFILAGIALLLLFGQELNLLALGDEKAFNLGVETTSVKKSLFIVSSFVTAACVSASGIIGFVGLIIPHVMRRIVGPNHQILIPASALGGAIFLVLCDTVARTIMAPVELPVGVITGFLGGIFFLIFLLKSHDRIL